MKIDSDYDLTLHSLRVGALCLTLGSYLCVEEVKEGGRGGGSGLCQVIIFIRPRSSV